MSSVITTVLVISLYDHVYLIIEYGTRGTFFLAEHYMKTGTPASDLKIRSIFSIQRFAVISLLLSSFVAIMQNN